MEAEDLAAAGFLFCGANIFFKFYSLIKFNYYFRVWTI